jgi:hypothetical protein
MRISVSNKKNIIYIIFTLIIFTLAYSVLFIFNEEKVFFWIKEDGFFEYASAIWYLLASVILIFIYFKYPSGNDFFFFTTRKNLFILLLGLLFFVACGEEISWGQRIFSISTPDNIKDINAQGELNIHNLNIFHGKDEYGNRKKGIENWLTLGRLFFLFWFSYCFIIPVLNRTSQTISKFFRKLNLPIVALWLGSMFLVNYILSRIVLFVNENINDHAAVEIKESNTALLFFMVAVSFMIISKRDNVD